MVMFVALCLVLDCFLLVFYRDVYYPVDLVVGGFCLVGVFLCSCCICFLIFVWLFRMLTELFIRVFAVLGFCVVFC